MASFSKEERVAFDRVLEGFQDGLVASRLVNTYTTDQQMMERSSDVIWRPMPYILPSFDGSDQTSNFMSTMAQLSVPSTIGIQKSVPFSLSANELRDLLQQDRLGESAKRELASEMNQSITTTASFLGSVFVKRTAAASGFDDLAAADAALTEIGVPMGDRCAMLSPRDYNSMAGNLAQRQTVAGTVQTAYERAFVGQAAGFDLYKNDTAQRLAVRAGTGVTVNGAGQHYVPRATSTAVTGETNNVDNRGQTLAITVTSGTVKVGDAFTIAGINSVHMQTKADTGQLQTFRIVEILTGAGGTGTVRIFPAIVNAAGGSIPELQYQNCTGTLANGASITFLNTATGSLNPFWHKSAIEILPGRIAVQDSGIDVMRGTTDQGFEMVMTRQTDINTHRTKYRFDVRYGVVMLQPQFAGVLMFSQP